MGQDDSLQLLGLLLSAILERMPRVDAADRLVVTAAEVEGPQRLSAIGAVGRPTDLLIAALPMVALGPIYDNIKVTA